MYDKNFLIGSDLVQASWQFLKKWQKYKQVNGKHELKIV